MTLREELAGLRKNLQKTDDLMHKMSVEFWKNGGTCCPYCGCPGYSDLSEKQERREERIKQILIRLYGVQIPKKPKEKKKPTFIQPKDRLQEWLSKGYTR